MEAAVGERQHMGPPYVEVSSALLLQSVLGGKKRRFSVRDLDGQLDRAGRDGPEPLAVPRVGRRLRDAKKGPRQRRRPRTRVSGTTAHVRPINLADLKGWKPSHDHSAAVPAHGGQLMMEGSEQFSCLCTDYVFR